MPRVPAITRQVGAPGGVGIRPETPVYDTGPSSVARNAEEIGKGLGELGEGVEAGAEAYRRELDKADTVATVAALNELERHRNDRWYDRDKGLLNQQGENAIRGADGFYEDFAKKRGDLAGRLNPRQRQLFEQKATALELETRRGTELHVSKETDRVAKDTFVAGIDTKLQSLVANPTDTLTRARTLTEARELAAAEAKRQGLSPEAAKAFIAEHHGKASSVILDSFIGQKDYGRAAEFFEANKQHLGPLSAKYEGTIRQLAVQAQSDAIARELVAGSLDTENQWVDKKKLEEAFAKRELSPEMRDAVESQLRDRERALEAKKEQDLDRNFNAAADAYLKTKNLQKVPPKTRDWLQRHDPKKWRELETWARSDAQAYRERRDANARTPAEMTAYTALWDKMTADPDKYRVMEPATFTRENLTKLTPRDFHELRQNLDQIKNKKPGDPDDLPTIARKSITALARNTGLLPQNDAEMTPAQARAMAFANDHVKAQAEAFTRAKGEAPTAGQFDMWAAEAFAKQLVTVPGRFYGTNEINVPRAALAAGADYDAPIEYGGYTIRRATVGTPDQAKGPTPPRGVSPQAARQAVRHGFDIDQDEDASASPGAVTATDSPKAPQKREPYRHAAKFSDVPPEALHTLRGDYARKYPGIPLPSDGRLLAKYNQLVDDGVLK